MNTKAEQPGPQETCDVRGCWERAEWLPVLVVRSKEAAKYPGLVGMAVQLGHCDHHKGLREVGDFLCKPEQRLWLRRVFESRSSGAPDFSTVRLEWRRLKGSKDERNED